MSVLEAGAASSFSKTLGPPRMVMLATRAFSFGLSPAIDFAAGQLTGRPVNARPSASPGQPIDCGGMVHRPLDLIQAVVFHSSLVDGLDNAHRGVGPTP